MEVLKPLTSFPCQDGTDQCLWPVYVSHLGKNNGAHNSTCDQEVDTNKGTSLTRIRTPCKRGEQGLQAVFFWQRLLKPHCFNSYTLPSLRLERALFQLQMKRRLLISLGPELDLALSSHYTVKEFPRHCPSGSHINGMVQVKRRIVKLSSDLNWQKQPSQAGTPQLCFLNEEGVSHLTI
ncbi:hypothetical protein EOD39_10739 [Acipenser ruthenus]|uniref:Uncharacterized protein n=1 Tax=Acipenser ruthenus TaxID=7906 RepID=A0A662YVB6_ACIRT|nr:hypothetical protein EOD39_10739 [Acipenser ruthenus]